MASACESTRLERRIESLSAAGDGGKDRDRVAFLDLRLERAEVPDVLVVHVEVDEPVELPLVRDDALGDPRVSLLQILEQRAKGAASTLDLRRSSCLRPQERRDPHPDRHERQASTVVGTPCSASSGTWPGVSPQNWS